MVSGRGLKLMRGHGNTNKTNHRRALGGTLWLPVLLRDPLQIFEKSFCSVVLVLVLCGRAFSFQFLVLSCRVLYLLVLSS